MPSATFQTRIDLWKPEMLKLLGEAGCVSIECGIESLTVGGREALANPYASLVFPWFAIRRQVAVCGAVERVERAETEAYFAVRPRGARLGAWASPQSAVIESRRELDDAWREMAERWPEGTPVPAPEHWGGLRVIPETVEFWQGRASRLHDRLRYRRAESGWLIERLAP